VIVAHALPTRLREALAWTDLLDAMSRDKKVRAGRIRFVVLTQLGQAETRDDIDLPLIEDAFVAVGARTAGERD